MPLSIRSKTNYMYGVNQEKTESSEVHDDEKIGKYCNEAKQAHPIFLMHALPFFAECINGFT